MLRSYKYAVGCRVIFVMVYDQYRIRHGLFIVYEDGDSLHGRAMYFNKL